MCDLEARRRVAALCIFYKINCNHNYALEKARLPRLAVSVHSRHQDILRCRTAQFAKSFVPAYVQLWNSSDEPCFAGDGVAAFKSQIYASCPVLD